MYDNICKFLAENFPNDLATWLLGQEVTLTKLDPKELFVDPIRADSVILLQSDKLILHVEFQTLPEEEIPFRMTDYRLRGHRRHPDKQMRQIVIYLQKVTSKRDLKLVKDNKFVLEQTVHKFQVIRLWEQPTDLFMSTPGLLPFAALSDTTTKEITLQAVAAEIEGIIDRRTQNNITASAAILAGLVLDEDIIQRILRRDIMRESVIYQSIKREGLDEGRKEGREEAREEFAANMLQNGIPIDTVVKITGLTLEKVQQLQAQQSENQS
jgi:predicted transposase/invertase (TIGR01784 family)